MSYSVFANFYDQLTTNVNYKKRAAYFEQIIKRYGNKGQILLDLACGTGSLSFEMFDLGYDVVGVDRSADMLNVAMDKKFENGKNVLFLEQSGDKLDMFGTIDVCICALDSINHITEPNLVQKTFDRVSLFLNPQGLFIFDVNTLHKQKNIMGNNVFVYETDEVYCVWNNEFIESEKCTRITLDFFEKVEDSYCRFEESFLERVYSHQEILAFLENAGLKYICRYDEDSFDEVKDTSERIVYVAKK